MEEAAVAELRESGFYVLATKTLREKADMMRLEVRAGVRAFPELETYIGPLVPGDPTCKLTNPSAFHFPFGRLLRQWVTASFSKVLGLWARGRKFQLVIDSLSYLDELSPEATDWEPTEEKDAYEHGEDREGDELIARLNVGSEALVLYCKEGSHREERHGEGHEEGDEFTEVVFEPGEALVYDAKLAYAESGTRRPGEACLFVRWRCGSPRQARPNLSIPAMTSPVKNETPVKFEGGVSAYYPRYSDTERDLYKPSSSFLTLAMPGHKCRFGEYSLGNDRPRETNKGTCLMKEKEQDKRKEPQNVADSDEEEEKGEDVYQLPDWLLQD